MYNEGLKYFTINAYRSMLSSTVPIIDGCKVGEHPLVCRLLKGIFNSRPPVRSLFPTWEIDVVLDHVRSWDHPSRLSLADLIKKTVFLLAIVSAKRVASLNNFSHYMLTKKTTREQ